VLTGSGLVQGGCRVQFLQAGDAGEGRQGGGEGGVGPGRPRFGFRDGAGLGEDEVAQPAVARVPVDEAVLGVLVLPVADLDADGVLRVVAHGGDLQAPAGGGGGDAGDGVVQGQQRGLAPGPGDVAEQPVPGLVPLGGAGPMPLLVSGELSFRDRAAAGMMLGMHPWTGLSDEVRLGVLTERVTAELVDEVLAECGIRDQKPGALPARFMVYYVLALALFQQDSYDDVAENLVGALEGMDEAIPNKSSFTRARQRLGAGVIEAVFRRLAGPVAPAGLDGAFWRGMRVAAVDGFVLDVPDTKVNRAEFGGPVDANGQAAGFPQARVVTLTETGTHSSVDARVGGFCGGEPELAIAMAASAAGMLVIMDRGFPGVALWKAYTQARAHLLIRARSSVARRPVQVLDDGTYLARMNLAGQKGAHPGGVLVRVIEYRVNGGEVIRLLTDLTDPAAFPAGELAALYHQRWESESSFRQVKTFQRGPQEILRSADPELVRQEVWAHLAVHHCLTRIIMRLAAQERIDPDRISFVKVLKHVRRSVIRQSAQTSVQIGQVMAMLAAKVRRKLDNGVRRLREAGRCLKRPASKYSFRTAGQVRRPTRRVAAKVLTLHPALICR
jgi:hypothetical protein